MAYMSDEERKAYHRNYYKTVMKARLEQSRINSKELVASEVIEKYLNGESTYQLSKVYGVDKTIIRRLLKKNKIELRDNIKICKERRCEASPMYTGYGEITGTKWGSIKSAAKIRNLEFLITIEEAWNLFLKQDRKCALTGDILFLAIDTSEWLSGVTTASLDRIDSSKGYTLDNVQWVHKYVNLMKRELSQQDFVDICCKVTNNYKGK